MELLFALVKLVVLLVVYLVLVLAVGQMEHKAMAHMQSRLGPMYAGGFHGWAQLVADGIKFAQKEDVVPGRADPVVFRLAPAVAFVPYFLALVVIPFGPGDQVVQRLDIGLFYALAVASVGVLGTLMAGWASANKFSLLGAFRAAAQLMAYELPLLLAAVSPAMAAGTLALTGIAEAWTPWWLVWQLPAGVVFYIASMAELGRSPFDMPVAETEIIFGSYTEYGGLRFALFLLSEYGGMVVFSALTTVLFLGAWRGPFLDEQLGWLWTLIKVFALCFLMIWARSSYPRLREDQLQRLAWVVLIPVALAQLALTGVVKVVTS
jgi:NADH-quinone oxidoreductase subunit H